MVVIYFSKFEPARIQEEDPLENPQMPSCQSCHNGVLVPLSDFGSQGAPIHYKAWVCTNLECGYNIKIRNGDVYVNEPINDGAMQIPRIR